MIPGLASQMCDRVLGDPFFLGVVHRMSLVYSQWFDRMFLLSAIDVLCRLRSKPSFLQRSILATGPRVRFGVA